MSDLLSLIGSDVAVTIAGARVTEAHGNTVTIVFEFGTAVIDLTSPAVTVTETTRYTPARQWIWRPGADPDPAGTSIRVMYVFGHKDHQYHLGHDGRWTHLHDDVAQDVAYWHELPPGLRLVEQPE
jgi:hypothetical protein